MARVLRQVEGHSNRTQSTIDKYWDLETPLKWPAKPMWELQKKEMWQDP